MNAYLNAVKHFITSEDGPTAVEYAVVAALIIVAAAAGITAFGNALLGWFNSTSAEVAGLDTTF